MDANPNWATSRPAIINWLYLASLITGLTAIVGAILAYIWKESSDDASWEKSHFRYQLRTFVVGLGVGMIGVLLSVVLIGIPILLALFVWFILRTVMSLQRAMAGQPMPDPTTLKW